jgi:uncharacterized protein
VGLVGHPGETRPLVDDVAVDAFGDGSWGPLDDAVLDPVRLDLHLDAVVEGILVRGTVGATLALECHRCLAPTSLVREVAVAELFIDPARHDPDEGIEVEEGYELLDRTTALELDTLVRDALVIDLPVRILCRPECRGICPECGAERDTSDCGHAPAEPGDARWGALADLRLPADSDVPDAPRA